MSELETKVWNAAQQAVYDAIKQRMNSTYDNPLAKMIDGVVSNRAEELRGMMDELFTAAIRSDNFKQAASEQLAHKVAKCLMSKMEGAIEKAANTLRSDPGTKARILLAIEKIVAEHQPAVSTESPTP
jgi:hypothetical protein